MTHIANIRSDYKQHSLTEGEVARDPIAQFSQWWDDAVKSKMEEVNAMTLATANAEGKPAARMVLLKGFDANGFVFFTNYNSHKAADIAANPFVSLLFFWKELERQVRIQGTISKIAEAESDAYFDSRPAESKIGAWASPQSQVIASREILIDKVKELEKNFENATIERPAHWGGYVVKPELIEFWQGRPGRLHDRIQYSKQEGGWKIDRLAP